MAFSDLETPLHESFLWENPTWAMLNSGSDLDESTKKQPSPLPLPPPPPPSVGKKRDRTPTTKKVSNTDPKVGNGNLGRKPGAAADSDHEIHIWTERERRKKMRNMFANLHALLPQLPPKADKSTIVDEAVNYIKTLQQTLHKLQQQKLERLQSAAAAFGYDAPPKPPCEPPSREAFMADQAGPSVLRSAVIPSAGVQFPPAMFQTWTSSNVVLSICAGEAHITICSEKKAGVFATICYVLEKHQIEVVSAHISSGFNRSMFMIQAHMQGNNGTCEGLMVEETFKQAAAEIIFWLSSSF